MPLVFYKSIYRYISITLKILNNDGIHIKENLLGACYRHNEIDDVSNMNNASTKCH